MSGETIGRLFVGVGFLWTAVVLVVGLLGGLDKPSAWVGFLADVSEWNVIRLVYTGLTLLVVPLGMLLYGKSVLTDPAALWVKFGTPGVMVAVYALFLAAAKPEVGLAPLLAVDALVPVSGLATSLDATGSWLVRFVILLVLVAGVPAVAGGVVGLLTGGGTPRYRP
jgi:hypothetical protein